MCVDCIHTSCVIPTTSCRTIMRKVIWTIWLTRVLPQRMYDMNIKRSVDQGLQRDFVAGVLMSLENMLEIPVGVVYVVSEDRNGKRVGYGVLVFIMEKTMDVLKVHIRKSEGTRKWESLMSKSVAMATRMKMLPSYNCGLKIKLVGTLT